MTGFVAPQPHRASGGHRYNASVIADWPTSRPRVEYVDGPWPDGDDRSIAALAAALTSHDVALVDGLVGAAHPALIADAAAAGRRIALLIHMPLANDPALSSADRVRLDALEGRSVRAAWRVVATSRTAAAELTRRHGRPDIVVVPPGVDPAPASGVHAPPHLLVVGALARHKNQLTVVRALTAVAGLRWRATIVGPDADPAYAAAVRSAAPPGVAFAGELHGAALANAFASADLLVHPARVEMWGMVVTEALARGVPAIVGAGTGAVEALASGTAPGAAVPGASVAPDDTAGLAVLLRAWLTDASLRDEWRHRALAAREHLGTWPDAAARLAAALEGP